MLEISQSHTAFVTLMQSFWAYNLGYSFNYAFSGHFSLRTVSLSTQDRQLLNGGVNVFLCIAQCVAVGLVCGTSIPALLCRCYQISCSSVSPPCYGTRRGTHIYCPWKVKVGVQALPRAFPRR